MDNPNAPPSQPPAVQPMLAQMLRAYAHLEPPGKDTWNPLSDELEMWHRARLLVEACRILKKLPRPLQELRILDVGCGVGRSSRMLVDLGAMPDRVVATDLRPAALALAQKVNPAIQWRHVSGLADWPLEPFDLAVQCTVFSSIPSHAARAETAARMIQSVGPQGYILWWDSRTANDFAGGDDLDPRLYFAGREMLDLRHVPLLPTTDEALRPLRGLKSLVAGLLRPLTHRSSHCIALIGPDVGSSSPDSMHSRHA